MALQSPQDTNFEIPDLYATQNSEDDYVETESINPSKSKHNKRREQRKGKKTSYDSKFDHLDNYN